MRLGMNAVSHDASIVSVGADAGDLPVPRIWTSDGTHIWALLPMRTFIADNDRARFKWSKADIEATPPSRNRNMRHVPFPDNAGPSAQQDMLPKHVNLVSSGTTLPIPLERIPKDVGKRLGKGKNTKVTLNWYPNTEYDRPLALKIIECSATPMVPMDKALVEVEIMQHLVHHHVVSYVASYEATNYNQYNEPEDQVLGIIMYPPGRCDLEMALTAVSREYGGDHAQPLSDSCLKQLRSMFGFFSCLSQALSYLHTTDVIIKHKDIKPANIIIDAFGQPLITDFGISKRYADEKLVSTQGGSTWTRKYAPPEAYSRGEKCGFRADVFSLGCVFLELLTVLLGESLENLRAHMQDQPYHRHLDRVKSWITNVLPTTPNRCVLRELLNEPRELTVILDNKCEKCKNEEKCEQLHMDQCETIHVSAREVLLGGVSDTILKMLSRSAKDRPHASELFAMFEPLYQYTENRQACDICKLQDQTRILPNVKEGYQPPMQAADYPPGIKRLKEELQSTEDKDADSFMEEISPIQTGVNQVDGPDIGVTDPSHLLDDDAPVGILDAESSALAHRPRRRTSLPVLPAIRTPATRQATSFEATSQEGAKWKRGILCYDIRVIRPNNHEHEVYIEHAEVDLGMCDGLRLPRNRLISTTTGNYTKVPIHRDLNIIFETLDRQGHATGSKRKIDLKQQGFSVLMRAASTWNKHVYVHGKVLAR
jgi:serine/threonine protein kinase